MIAFTSEHNSYILPPAASKIKLCSKTDKGWCVTEASQYVSSKCHELLYGNDQLIEIKLANTTTLPGMEKYFCYMVYMCMFAC